MEPGGGTLLGMCEETNDFGRKETAGVALLTREVSNGNKIWLPNLSQLPSVEINGSQIPLVSSSSNSVCVLLHDVVPHVRIVG